MALRDFEGNQGGKSSESISRETLLDSLWDLVDYMTDHDEDALISMTNRLIAASYIVGRSTNFELLAHITPSIEELEANDEQEEYEPHNTIKIEGGPIDIAECIDAKDYSEPVKSGIFCITSGAKQIKVLFDKDELDIHVSETGNNHGIHKLNILSEYYQSNDLSPDLITLIQKGITATRRSRELHKYLGKLTPNNAMMS
jgi:hypothetical protein